MDHNLRSLGKKTPTTKPNPCNGKYIYKYIFTHTPAIFLAIISYSCGNMTSVLKKLSQVKTQPAEQVTFKYSAIEEY